MKRFIALLAVLLIFIPFTVHAAEHVYWRFTPMGGDLYELYVDWKADGSGDLTETTLNRMYYNGTNYGGSLPWMDTTVYILSCITDPGSTAPADNYELLLDDSFALPVFGTALDGLDTASTEDWVPDITSRPSKMPFTIDQESGGGSNNADCEGETWFYFVIPTR